MYCVYVWYVVVWDDVSSSVVCGWSVGRVGIVCARMVV